MPKYKLLLIILLLSASFFIIKPVVAADYRCIYVSNCGTNWPQEKDPGSCSWQLDSQSGTNCCTNDNGQYYQSPYSGLPCPSNFPTTEPDKSKCTVGKKCCCPINASGETSSFCPETDDKLLPPIIFTPQISIPGSEFQEGESMTLKTDTSPIGDYIKAYYKYGLGIVGIVAAIMLMIGGIIWLTAGGSGSKIEQAKDMITSSLIGLFILLGSWIILNTINPDLVTLKTREVTLIEDPACCQYANPDKTTGGTLAGMFSPSLCKDDDIKGKSYKGMIPDSSKTKCVYGGCCLRISRSIRPATAAITLPFAAFKDQWNSIVSLFTGQEPPPSAVFEYSFSAWDSLIEDCSSNTIVDISGGSVVLSALTAGFTSVDVGYSDRWYEERCSALMCCKNSDGSNKTNLTFCLTPDREAGQCVDGLCSTE